MSKIFRNYFRQYRIEISDNWVKVFNLNTHKVYRFDRFFDYLHPVENDRYFELCKLLYKPTTEDMAMFRRKYRKYGKSRSFPLTNSDGYYLSLSKKLRGY